MIWFFAILSAILVALSFPIDGIPGVLLALAGIGCSVVAISAYRRKAGGVR